MHLGKMLCGELKIQHVELEETCNKRSGKFKNLGKAVLILPENLDIQNVKQYLTDSRRLKNETFRKRKTLRLLEHRQVFHSLRFLWLQPCFEV